MLNLDAKDMVILKMILQNAKTSPSEIAKAAGISQRTVARRIDALEHMGYIQGYRASLRADVEEALSEGLFGETLKVRLSLKEWEVMFERLSKLLGMGGSLVSSQAGEAVGRELARSLNPPPDPSKALLGLASAMERRGLLHLILHEIDNEGCKGVIGLDDLPGHQSLYGYNAMYHWAKGLLTGYLKQTLGETITVSSRNESSSKKPSFSWEREGDIDR